MSAAQYGVNFGYKAQDGYWYGPSGRVGKYHRGNDRPTPTGTPIIISGVTIGLTGATGIVSGPHLHTQACTAGANWSNDVDPSPYEFKNGTVVQAGYHSQFGNYIMIRVGGVDITYAHLSKINVSVGQVIGAPQGGNEVANRDQVNNIYRAVMHRDGDPGGLANYTGRDANAIIAEMLGSQEWLTSNHITLVAYPELVNKVNQMQAVINDLSSRPTTAQYAQAQAKLNDLAAEITQKAAELEEERKKVKEVVVTKEVVKEVEPTWLTKVREFINTFLKKG